MAQGRPALMDDPDSHDADFATAIGPDVLRILRKARFFERLDDRFCPLDPSVERARCGQSFAISTEILRDLEMDSDDIEDVLEVLSSQGACCDCEVLYNVAEESRLRSECWKARALEPGSATPEASIPDH
jgi:Protein of unknown function (DUF2695)